MPKTLVAGATGSCDGPSKDHSGVVTFSAGSSLLTVAGAGAVVVGREVGVTIVGYLHLNKVSGAPAGCKVTQGATGGVSQKLTVQGQRVLLEGATGPALNTDPPDVLSTWKMDAAGQALLSVVS